MATTAAPTLDLETLVVKIVCDVSKFIPRMDKVDAQLAKTELAFKQFAGAITATAVPAIASLTAALSPLGSANSTRLQKLAASITSLTTSLSSLSSVGTLGNLTSVVTSLSFLRIVSPARMLTLSRSIATFSTALQGLNAVNMSSFMAGGMQLVNWFNQFNALSPQTVNTVTRLGLAMARFNRFAGPGATLPTVNVANSLNLIPPAASAATGSLGRMTGGLNNMYSSSMLASNGLAMLRFGLAGIAAFGVSTFARLDDSLARVLARMRLFPGMEGYDVSSSVLKRGVSDIASGSVTSRADLLKGLSILNPDMNVAMAIEALGTAETFAVAGAMDMHEAARRLTDTLSALGVNAKSTTTYLAEMKRISDLLVGTSLQVGGTTKDLSEAFSGKYISTLKAVGIETERGIALLGAYSRLGVGKDFRGAGAGDMAARALLEIDKNQTRNFANWQLMGVTVRNAAGDMLPFEQRLASMQKRFDALTPSGGMAFLRMLGFEGFRDLRAILPLVQGSAKAMTELMENMKGMGNISERVADAIRRDFLGQLKILWNNVTNAATAIGEHLAPAIGLLATGLQTATRWFTNLNPAMQNLIVVGAALRYGLLPASRLLMSIGASLAAPFVIAGTIIYKVIATTVEMMFDLASMTFRAFWSVASAIHNFLMNIGSVISKVALAVVTGVTNVILHAIPTLISFLANAVVWFISLSAAAALLATVLVGIGELAVVIGAGLSSLADSFKNNAEAIGGSIVSSFNRAGESVLSMWKNAEAGAREFAGVAKNVIKDVAGFFWNFGENVNRIIHWIGDNWETIIVDLVAGIGTAMSNTLENIKRLGTLLSGVFSAVWMGMWDAGSAYAEQFFAWLKMEWQHVLSDVGTIFKAFLLSFMHNLRTIAGDIFNYLTGAGTHGGFGAEVGHALTLIKIAFNPFLSNKESVARGHAEKRFMEGLRKGEMKDSWLTDIKGPGEFLKDFTPSTSFGSLGKFMDTAKGTANLDMAIMMKSLTKTFSDMGTAEKGFVPLLKSFTAITPKLSLALGMPPDALSQISGWIRRALGSGVGPEEPGLPMSHGGPGFQFKQISEARYMLGGPAAERLDAQQLTQMQMTNKTLAEIKAIMEGRERSMHAPGPVTPIGPLFEPQPLITW